MSATSKTPNFNLPLYNPTDTIAFIPDWNEFASSVDTNMEINKTLSNQNSSDISEINLKIENINNSIALLNNVIPTSIIITPTINNSNVGSGSCCKIYNYYITQIIIDLTNCTDEDINNAISFGNITALYKYNINNLQLINTLYVGNSTFIYDNIRYYGGLYLQSEPSSNELYLCTEKSSIKKASIWTDSHFFIN